MWLSCHPFLFPMRIASVWSYNASRKKNQIFTSERCPMRSPDPLSLALETKAGPAVV